MNSMLNFRVGTLQGMDTYPTKREKENHRLKMPFLGGYVSSLDGI